METSFSMTHPNSPVSILLYELRIISTSYVNVSLVDNLQLAETAPVLLFRAWRESSTSYYSASLRSRALRVICRTDKRKRLSLSSVNGTYLKPSPHYYLELEGEPLEVILSCPHALIFAPKAMNKCEPRPAPKPGCIRILLQLKAAKQLIPVYKSCLFIALHHL